MHLECRHKIWLQIDTLEKFKIQKFKLRLFIVRSKWLSERTDRQTGRRHSHSNTALRTWLDWVLRAV